MRFSSHELRHRLANDPFLAIFVRDFFFASKDLLAGFLWLSLRSFVYDFPPKMGKRGWKMTEHSKKSLCPRFFSLETFSSFPFPATKMGNATLPPFQRRERLSVRPAPARNWGLGEGKKGLIALDKSLNFRGNFWKMGSHDEKDLFSPHAPPIALCSTGNGSPRLSQTADKYHLADTIINWVWPKKQTNYLNQKTCKLQKKAARETCLVWVKHIGQENPLHADSPFHYSLVTRGIFFLSLSSSLSCL